jgi:rod shape-determining protein MreC
MEGLKRTLFIGIIFVCAFLIAHTVGVLAPIEKRVGFVFSRMSGIGTHVSVFFQNKAESFAKKQESPVQTVEERVKRLEIENAALTIAKIENDTLREQLHFMQKSKFHVQLAHRIGWTTDVRRSGFIIDKGKKDGIALSAPVLAENGIFIGKISNVSEATSNVTLLNDSKSKITAIIAATPPTTGVVNGQFGLGLTVNLIPMSEKITIGDIVETSGLEDGIPAGLLVGTIATLNTAPTDLFQTASVSSAIDYTRIRIVSVLIQ